jgi:trk system potassium uptake protein TrkA
VRVAVAGAGSVGAFIATELATSGHSLLLIESRPAAAAKLVLADGIDLVVGDACEVSTLKEAGLDRCDVVVAATGDDEDNLVVSLLAKQEFAVPRVIARVNHPKNQWMFDETWGVDIAVSTPHLITSLVDEAVSVGRLVRLFQLEGGQVGLVEVTLAADAPVVGQPIRELDVPRDATFVAVIRDEHVVMARGDTVLQQGDEVLALVTPDSEDLVRQMLTGG